jgi:type I restriction enzyme S subunit
MLKQKNYTCEICKTKPDQLSHHKTHLETMKHKDKKELFELKLSKLNELELQEKYNTTDISTIILETEIVEYHYKKLINDNNNNNNNIIMSTEQKLIIDSSKSISNKEALKDKIHEIHNFLRNNGAGYGMNALKVFNFLYGLKKIEENNLIDQVDLKRPICEFSYLVKLANENKDEELASLILNDIATSVYRSDISDLLFYEIPGNIKGSVFSYLIKEIDNITKIEKSCNVLLSGKIYEYFIGRDQSAISELGAYFTDRHIVNYIFSKLKPTINNDGDIETMIDMFGGSGGFTTGYINYLNNNYNIDWSKNLNKIYHNDMNEDVIISAGLEFLCLTGTLPNMNDNLKYKNSFTDEFNDMKFKYIITNPPYGGDKIKISDASIKRNKIKDYIKEELKTLTNENKIKLRMKQLKIIENEEKQEKKDSDKTKVSIDTCSNRIIKFSKEYNLIGNDKEACSLILMMDTLAIDGTCIGVLKEGVFFNKTYKNLRKCLIENYNVREVISIPQDQFENTSTKTSIIIFDNTEQKTNNITFSDLIVQKYTDDKFEEICGQIVLTENKDDIYDVIDSLISKVTKEEILNNPICSLNGKDYNKKEIICGDDYELVKLGDICNFLSKSKRKASFGKLQGKYNFYTSSDKVQKCDIADYNEESIIIGDGGIANIKLDNIFSCSDHNYIIKTKYNKYIYYLIIGNMKLLIDGFSGSVLKNISKEYLTNLQIPIPKSEDKIHFWINKISEPYNLKNQKELEFKELEEEIKNKIKDITDNEECEETELGSICKYIKTGKNKTPDNKQGTLYPYYGTADITGYTDYYLFDEKHILVARNGTMGNCFLVEGKIYPSDHIFVIKNIDSINIIFIYYLIKSLSKEIQYNSNGSTIKGISKENLSKIKIKLPKNKELITNLEPLFNKIETLQNEIKENNILYQQYIKELSKDAIPTNNIEEIKEIKVIKVKELSKDAIPTNNIEEIKVKKSKKNIII